MRNFRLRELLKRLENGLEGQKTAKMPVPSRSRSREAVETAYKQRFATLDRAFDEIEDPFLPSDAPDRPVAAPVEILPGQFVRVRRAERRLYIERSDESSREDLP